MKNKTEELNQLFSKWEKDYPSYKGHIVKDGIINEHKYNVEKTKILFICKEPNNPNQKEGDFRTWWKDEVKYIFSIRIGTWAYGILNGFKPLSEIKRSDLLESLSRISFINLKKIGGKGSSSKNEIIKHTEENLMNLKEQIRIIDPNIIVLGLSRWNKLRSILFSDKELEVIGNYIHGYGKKIIINFYHPAARGKGITNDFLYSELKKIVNTARGKP